MPQVELSQAVEDDIHSTAVNLCSAEALETLRPTIRASTREEIERKTRDALQSTSFCLLKAPRGQRSLEDYRRRCWLIAQCIGEPVQQDISGRRLVEVFDRKKGRIQDGARYHQTRDAGEIHNDNVNTPEKFQYLVLGCGRKAKIGGATVLVRVDDVLAMLNAATPLAVRTLCEDFLFEKRGMSSAPELFESPVLELGDRATIRYLRSYIESAYRIAGRPLHKTQQWAMDCLDAAIYSPEIHVTTMLEAGDVLIAEDLRVLHGRCPFQDDEPDDANAGRVMFRIWTKRSPYVDLVAGGIWL